MKAVRFHEFGDADVLRYEDVDEPTPGPAEVRVRVAATSFNSVDGNIRAGLMQGPIPVTLPHTPGLDVAGTIDSLGDGVSHLATGDAVVGFLPMVADGASAEYALAPAEILTAAPSRIPLLEAAALPLVGLTAWQAVFEHAQVAAGQRVADQRRQRRGRRIRRAAGEGQRRPRHRHREPPHPRTGADSRPRTRSSTTPQPR